jgi:hypothetical protein
LSPHLPNDMARCRPTACQCPQALGCARATDWPNQQVPVVDASAVLGQQSWCPMFIDKRGLALRAVQQAVPA